MLSRVLSFNLDSMKRAKSLDFDDNHAVVYDPLNQVLFQGSKQALESEIHIEIPIKDCRTKVDLCVPLRTSRPARNQKRAHSDPSFYLATVDLGRLGKNVRNGVKSGKIKNVYVLGYVPDELVDEPRGERTDEE